jgi:soluble lytic murein transglycosylase-like protein
MNTPTMRVTGRIAMLEGRFGALHARALAGSSGGSPGGVVGTGMAAAIATASAATAASRTGETAPVPAGAAGSWAARLPAVGAAHAPAIEAAAARHGLEPELLGALVWTESGFDPQARSGAGAIGLGQLMPGTAAELGVDPYDPVQNLDGAARYLRQQIDRFGDVRLALAAYNAGPSRVASAGGVPAITETQNYVERVTARAATLGGR